MIVTSFSPEGYDLYGQRFIESYRDTGNEQKLVVYVEGQDQLEKVAMASPDVIVRDLLAVRGVGTMLDEMGKNKYMRGMTETPDGQEFHTWRLDAFRYSRKVFAFHHAITEEMDHDGDRYLFWVDADVVFKSRLPDEMGKILMPMENGLCYLGRAKMHSETGFVGVDTKKPRLNHFLATYWGLYATGAFSHLREWHDCYVFDVARILSCIQAHDLTTDHDSLYPWDTSVLSQWMEHHKGPARKHDVYGGEDGEPEDDR